MITHKNDSVSCVTPYAILGTGFSCGETKPGWVGWNVLFLK